jgi:type I restriction enzyme R subunit
MNYTEKHLEDHIEKSLHQSGYKSMLHTAYDKQNCIIPDDLIEFIRDTQQLTYDKLAEQYGSDTDQKLVQRLSNEIAGRGIIDVLRKGFKDRGCHFSLVYFKPKSGLNPDHELLYRKNRHTCIRQLRYSTRNENSLDMVLFVNGIPIVTMELKNQLTGQDISDSEKQYRQNRDPKEALFQFKRVIVHFCCDNDKVSMTTRLDGAKTRFLPYNKGIDNPINPRGLKTAYLWEDILTPDSLLDILENFTHIAIETDKDFDPKLGKVVEKKKELLIFPRYHQLDVIRKLRDEVKREGVGHNYLIKHTTGSGKSYSIGWLAHLLTALYRNPNDSNRIFDTIIVVTDRKVLDKQLQQTIRQLEQTIGVVNPVDVNSKQLQSYLELGKDIIITTIFKFPVISETISQLRSKTFGIIIDEVHSSQSGESSKHLKKSLSKGNEDDAQEDEDILDIDEVIREEIRVRGKQNHISFFGFSGTPKKKTLELFGRKNESGGFDPFHTYTMKQSIAEGFTLDVLSNYTTYQQWFKLNKRIEEDKSLPLNSAMKRLVNFVDDESHTIRQKVKIILDHFVNQTSKKLEGRARAMVVVRSRLHCVRYKLEMDAAMKALNLPYGCLAAFSGTVTDEKKYPGKVFSESGINKLPHGISIPDAVKDPKYRILIVSNKYQTGYDEPLLHTMYVDKTLGDLQCVQTLSRLNRTTSGKTDTFVLDFVNTADDILDSFQQHYQNTSLTGETDPNRLYTIETETKSYNIFSDDEINEFCEVFYDSRKEQELLQPLIDKAVLNWKSLETEEERERFRSAVQSYLRLYGYISQIVSFEDIDLEKLYVYLRYLGRKLPKRNKPDMEDITSLVDLDSFRIEETFKGKISLEDKDGKFDPIQDSSAQTPAEAPYDLLSQIIERINEVYGGNITDEDKIDLENMKKRVSANEELRVVMTSDNSETNKRHKFDEVLAAILLSYVNNRLDFYNKMEDPKIKSFIGDLLFSNLKHQFEMRS